ncbi:MAG: hypothetical protein M3N52_09675 [Actinomycetota bacterium]|nr:hypothetical protein [Actinomycetota bacterium]
MRLKAALCVLALLTLSACGGGRGSATEEGRLPASDHVHALRASGDVLLLGLHGSLWRSQDGGRTWQQLGMKGQDAMAIGAPPDSAGPLLVGGHGVLVRRKQGSRSFATLSPPELGSLDIHALAQAPSDPFTVYAFAVADGIFASTDGGDSWELRAPTGQQFGADITALAVDPQDPQVVLAAGVRSGILRSSDGARTFAKVSEVEGTVALAYLLEQRVVALSGRGIEVSDDGGQRWRAVTSLREIPGQPVTMAASESSIWLVTEGPRTLQRSDDEGRTWQEVARA